nr:ribonuclease H-like domain-containing protein [Tanacetum cinerariifolium]
MHKAFPLPGESSHWQYMFPLPVKVVPTARRLEMPLPEVCTVIEEMMKKLPVKDRWQRRVQRETNRSQNHSYKSPSHRSDGHRPNSAPMRPPLRSFGPRPHEDSMRLSFRPTGHRQHAPSINPMRPTMNVKNSYRAPWVPTVNRYDPPVNRKFSTGRRNFPTANRKFPTASRKSTTGSTKNHIADTRRKGKAVKPSACWTWNPSQELSNKGPNNNSVSVISQNNIDDKGYWDSGCSRHMTGNGTIKTDSECIVLGRNFKLLDDTNILLRTPRQHNMYSIDLYNIVPLKDLICLVAKASADESILWHRRL